MSEEQLRAFLEKVKSDTELQEKLNAEGADLVAIANSVGFVLSIDDLSKMPSAELTLKELETISGGTQAGDTMWCGISHACNEQDYVYDPPPRYEDFFAVKIQRWWRKNMFGGKPKTGL